MSSACLLHSSTLKGKWSISLSIHGYSFHPTVFSEKAEHRIGACCVWGRGQSWPAKRSRVPHLVLNQAHSTTRWPNSSICPVTQARPASSARDQTQPDGIFGPVLSAWVSHHKNTQGKTVNTASLGLLCVRVCVCVISEEICTSPYPCMCVLSVPFLFASYFIYDSKINTAISHLLEDTNTTYDVVLLVCVACWLQAKSNEML